MDKKHRFTLHVNMDDFIPATDEEKSYIVQMRPSTTFFKDGVKRLCRNKVALVSLIVVAIITLSAILIPAFWPYSYDQQLGVRPGKPVDASFNNLAPFEYGKTELKRIEEGEKVFPHVFGTDSAGRDYFIRVVYGTRISLAVGFFASLIVLIIGMTVGSIAGYCGGKVDLIIMRIVDIIYSLPDTLMVILLATVLKVSIGDKLDGTPLAKIGSNIISLFIVFAVLYWVSMARLIRGQILSLREQEYVLAAQATGAKGRWIITRHLVPVDDHIVRGERFIVIGRTGWDIDCLHAQKSFLFYAAVCSSLSRTGRTMAELLPAMSEIAPSGLVSRIVTRSCFSNCVSASSMNLASKPKTMPLSALMETAAL